MESIGFIKDKFREIYVVKYRKSKIHDRTCYHFELYKETEFVGAFEFDVYDDEEYAISNDASIEPKYQDKRIYSALLLFAKDFLIKKGLKGIKSEGIHRNGNSDASWSKVPGAKATKSRYPIDDTDPKGFTYIDYTLESKMLLSRDKIVRIAEAMNKYEPGLKVWIHFPITEDLIQCNIDESTRDKVLLSIPEDSDLFGAPKFWFKKANIVGTVSEKHDANEKDK